MNHTPDGRQELTPIQTGKAAYDPNPYNSPETPFARLSFSHDRPAGLGGEPHGVPQAPLLRCYDLSKSDYSIAVGKALGKGAFSVVCNGILEHRTTCDSFVVALKIPRSVRQVKVLEKEMRCYSNLIDFLNPDVGSPIIDCYGFYPITRKDYARCPLNEELPSLVLENMDGTLEDYITSIKLRQEEPVSGCFIGIDAWSKLAKALIEALVILKEANIVHCDLKSSNVLFKEDELHFKVCDFTSSGSIDSIARDHAENKVVSTTLQFCSPEVVGSPASAPDFQSDLYAVGLILLHAATGFPPYFGISNVTRRMMCVQKGAVFETLDPVGLKRVLQDRSVHVLLEKILMKRCTIDEIKKHLV